MCGRREQETALPLRRLPAHLEGIRDGGRVSARRVRVPNPLISMKRVQGHPWCHGECDVNAGVPTPRGQVSAPVCTPPFQATCPPIPVPPSLPPRPHLTCEGLLRGRRYQGCEREAWSRGSVPSHTHTRQPPTHPPEPGMEAALYVILLSPLFFTCPVTNSPWS